MVGWRAGVFAIVTMAGCGSFEQAIADPGASSSTGPTVGSGAAANTSSPPADGTDPGSTETAAAGTTTAATTVDATATSSTTDGPEGTWWDTDWAYRVPLTISETADGVLPAGYSVAVTVDTASLVMEGKLLDDAADLRVVADDGVTLDELDRRLTRADDTSAEVWFSTAADIDAESTDYWLYYGNPAAGPAPAYWSDSMGADAPSRVYLAADDFSEHAAGECPDGWDACGGNFEVVVAGPAHELFSGANGLYLLAGDDAWGDVLVEGRLRADDPQQCPGIASRVEGSNDLVWAGWDCASGAVPNPNVSMWSRVAGSYTALVWTATDPGTTYHRVAMAWTGSDVRLLYDGQLVDIATAPPRVAATGRAGFFSSYGGNAHLSEILVRRYVDPEPTVSAGAEQAFPG